MSTSTSAAARRAPATETRGAARWARTLRVRALTALTVFVDAGPSWVRFGKGRSLRNRLLVRELPVVAMPADRDEHAPARHPHGDVGGVRVDVARAATVVLATRTLGTGGVEAIVAALARALPASGIDVVVVCERGGATAQALRADGVRVDEVADAAAMTRLLSALPADTVVHLNNAPDFIVDVCRARATPMIAVIHTTDINLGDDDWRRQAELAATVSATIAVSATVRDFAAARIAPLSAAPSAPALVIPNGVASEPLDDDLTRAARAALSAVTGTDLAGAVVFVCLARYDMQKNIPGLVAAFLAAAAERDDVHLVVAGPVEDWLEPALGDALRRADPNGDRVHLLGASSARALLAAADAFVLDSFFEGWPVAATEAVMAGIPLVSSEVGGAVELVGAAGERGALVPNASGPPHTCTLAAVRAARRRPTAQTNRAELVRAITAVAGDIAAWRAARPALAAAARQALDDRAMAAAHAAVIVGAAQGTRRA